MVKVDGEVDGGGRWERWLRKVDGEVREAGRWGR